MTKRKIRELIHYNSETGEVKAPNSINVVSRGYLRVYLKGKSYYLHKLVWVYMYGRIRPDDKIGFIDGDKLNLKISNLGIYTGRGRASKIQFKDGEYII